MVFVDGVGDIALIKTGINFVGSKYKPLRLANEHAKTGDRCIVVGDPAMMDSDSMSCGIVRSARYEMKPIAYQINECLHTDAPTLGGSSGSPMLNEDGEIIAMLTYGHEGTSTFGGGPNSISIRKSLSVLAQFRDNREKKYLRARVGSGLPDNPCKAEEKTTIAKDDHQRRSGVSCQYNLTILQCVVSGRYHNRG